MNKEEKRAPIWVYPLLIPTSGFVLGIIAYNNFPLIGVYIILLIIGAVIYIFPRRTANMWGWVVAGFMISLSCGAIRYYAYKTLPSNHLKNFVKANKRFKVALRGKLITQPEFVEIERRFPYQEKPQIYTRFIIRAEVIKTLSGKFKTSGFVYIKIPTISDNVQIGDTVEILGKLEEIQTIKSTLGSRPNYFEQNNIFVQMIVSPEDIRVIKTPLSSKILGKIKGGLYSLTSAFDILDTNVNRVASAIVGGKRNYIEYKLNQAFLRIGAAHFLAVSGFHLAILALFIWVITRSLGVYYKYSAGIVLLISILYMVLTGARPATVRSAIMVGVFCVGIILGRETKIINVILFSGLMMLTINPAQLFSAGFQLSFVSLIGIILLTDKIYKFLFSEDISIDDAGSSAYKTISSTIVKWFKKTLCVSISANLSAMPIVMLHFKILPILGPISSIVLFLPVTILVIAGFMYLIVFFVIPILSAPLAWVVEIVGKITINLAYLLAKIPGINFSIIPPSWWLIGIFYIFLFAPFKRKTRVLGISGCMMIYLAMWLIPAKLTLPTKCIFIDNSKSGQLIIIKDGNKSILIDAGSRYVGKAGNIVKQFNTKYLTKTKCLIITNTNINFINGVWDLLEERVCPVVYIPKTFRGKNINDEPFIRLINEENIKKIWFDEQGRFPIVSAEIEYFPKSVNDSLAIVWNKIFITSIITENLIDEISGKHLKTIIFNGKSKTEMIVKLIKNIDFEKVVITGKISEKKYKRIIEDAKNKSILKVSSAQNGMCLVVRK